VSRCVMGKRIYKRLKCPFCGLPVGVGYLKYHVKKYHLDEVKESG